MFIRVKITKSKVRQFAPAAANFQSDKSNNINLTYYQIIVLCRFF